MPIATVATAEALAQDNIAASKEGQCPVHALFRKPVKTAATAVPETLVPTEGAASLSSALREGTAEAHKNAEGSHFTREFIKCNVDKNTYIAYLTAFRHVYSVLEAELENHSHNPVVQLIHFPQELDRLDAIDADIAYLSLPQKLTPSTLPISPAAQAYTSRIKSLSGTPELLVAHAYVRYMGDLSGGQILSRKIRKALSLPNDGSGSAFYEFEYLGATIGEFKKVYRHRLDLVPAEFHEAIVKEANLVFDLNAAIFTEVDKLLPSSSISSDESPDSPSNTTAPAATVSVSSNAWYLNSAHFALLSSVLALLVTLASRYFV
ncbi:hypothetical protein DFS34DRAFT_128328 [Phlyctochytrium arcticum]|nr:hypothetical protein DFS34DRAFT_128328 [Phlyctochytrium arcticum]